MLTIKEAEEVLKKDYYTENFEYLMDEVLLPDYIKDVHDVSFNNALFSSVKMLGESKSCEVTVFEVFVNEDCQNRRVGITQKMFKILRGLHINNALVAFVNADKNNYRISLLTSRYEFDGDKIVKVLSNPRRFSYSLGYGTKTKTAYKFLIEKGKVESLNELISRFSVEIVNKQFYSEIATAFTELVGGERNGKTYDRLLGIYSVIDHNKYAEFGVRLIGRIMFCWFLREKRSENGIPLVPDDMLSINAINESNNYYHQILEPLFFELLNTNQNRRRPEYQSDYYNKVPYLNGGLFSPQPDDYYKYDTVSHCGAYGVVDIPNEWFAKLYSVLSEYNFTVDENTAYDIELSIDPEMLGRIFENLLAEINPETGENAKKSTGSFYTPRDIVDYMVDSSLCEYLKNKTGVDEIKLKALISYSKEDDDLAVFENAEKKKLIDALYKVTALDPACGSGAYPIGMLQKIVYILQELDPDATLWFDKATENVSILIKKEFEKKFNSGSLNYIRKLSVIQNSIFGIDIQPIAVEISRLRCFLSLIIEEKVHDDEENRGINPLPNLDFKFIIANSLLKLENNGQLSLFENQEHIDQLKAIREEYFNADSGRRAELKLEFSSIQQDMLVNTINNYDKHSSRMYSQLSEWKPFADESTDWFEPEWMFGINDGFDIVIGNPPYGLLNKKQNQKSSINVSEKALSFYKKDNMYAPAKGGMINIYRLFICRSHYLLNPGGHLSLIFPMAFLCDLSAYELRKFIFENETVKYIEAFPERDDENKRVFQSAKMSVCILISEKSTPHNGNNFKLRINDDRFVNTSFDQVDISSIDIKAIDEQSLTIPLVTQDELELMLKICTNKKRMKEISKCYTGEIDLSLNKKYIHTENSDKYQPMLRGAQVQRYYTTNNISQGDILFLDSEQYLSEITSPRSQHYKRKRIVMQGITGVNEKYRLKMAILNEGYFCANSVNYLVLEGDFEYILGICNSKLMNWFFKKLSTNSNVNGYEIDNLPIAIAKDGIKEELSKMVSLLLENLLENADEMEKKIDELIYNIYCLTNFEIEIIERASK